MENFSPEQGSNPEVSSELLQFRKKIESLQQEQAQGAHWSQDLAEVDSTVLTEDDRLIYTKVEDESITRDDVERYTANFQAQKAQNTDELSKREPFVRFIRGDASQSIIVLRELDEIE